MPSSGITATASVSASATSPIAANSTAVPIRNHNIGSCAVAHDVAPGAPRRRHDVVESVAVLSLALHRAEPAIGTAKLGQPLQGNVDALHSKPCIESDPT